MEMDDFRVFFFASFCPVRDEGTGICFLGCPVLSCDRCILADANSRKLFFPVTLLLVKLENKVVCLAFLKGSFFCFCWIMLEIAGLSSWSIDLWLPLIAVALSSSSCSFPFYR